MEDKEKIEKIVREAKDLLLIFEEYKEKSDINSKSILLKNLDRMVIAKHIMPYLGLKDVINLRSTCKDINYAVSSTVALVSYYKTINPKNSQNIDNSNNLIIKNLTELNDSEDIQIQLDNAIRV
jgi:hypothetical protein